MGLCVRTVNILTVGVTGCIVCPIAHPLSLCHAGVVKKLTGGFFKIVHEKFRAKNGQDDSDLHNTVLDEVYKNNQELRSMGIKDTVSPSVPCYYLYW